MIERSWLMQESPPFKHDWCDDIKLSSMRYGGTPHYILNVQILYHKSEVVKQACSSSQRSHDQFLKIPCKSLQIAYRDHELYLGVIFELLY